MLNNNYRLLLFPDSAKCQPPSRAGNLLALPNGKLCYLDFGMVSSWWVPW